MYNVLSIMVLFLINILLPVNISFAFIIIWHYEHSFNQQYDFCADLIIVVTMMLRPMCRSLDFRVVGHLKIILVLHWYDQF